MEKYYAGVFIYRKTDQSVLLQFRDGNGENPWCFSLFWGGSESSDMDPTETAVREFQEETWVTLHKNNLSILRSYYNQNHQSMRHVFLSRQNVPVNTIRLWEWAWFSYIPLDRIEQFSLTPRTLEDLLFFRDTLLSSL